MDSIRQIVLQEANEERFNRKHIDLKIRVAMQKDPIMVAKINQGIELVTEWKKGEYYDSKMARIAQLENLDTTELVTDILVGVAYFQRPELFSSVAAQMAARLKFSDKAEAITTTAELLAVLCQTDAFDINKGESQSSSYMLVSCIPLPKSLIEFIENSQFLPPMVCRPLELTHNYSSGYLTHNDSLMLGSGNHHDGDLCLDVLNILNGVELQLDTQFLSKIEEQPTFELDNQDKQDGWMAFKRVSYAFYILLAQQGNRFYLTHKVDKRGRIYAMGYHVSTQGTPFKKAAIELANEEMVSGVPEHLMIKESQTSEETA